MNGVWVKILRGRRERRGRQEGPKRASRDPKSRSRGLKTHSRAPKSIPRRPKGFSEAPGSAVVFGKFIKFKSRLQKASKTLKIADIDESQRPCLKSQNEKRRAGGGDPPWGSQSAARPVGAEQGVLDRTPKSPNLKALICLRHLQISKSELLAPPLIPPGGQRIPPDRPK